MFYACCSDVVRYIGRKAIFHSKTVVLFHDFSAQNTVLDNQRSRYWVLFLVVSDFGAKTDGYSRETRRKKQQLNADSLVKEIKFQLNQKNFLRSVEAKSIIRDILSCGLKYFITPHDFSIN